MRLALAAVIGDEAGVEEKQGRRPGGAASQLASLRNAFVLALFSRH
jgi:hypothetical protein